nr:hypothetical protein [Anaerolineae bacterium]
MRIISVFKRLVIVMLALMLVGCSVFSSSVSGPESPSLSALETEPPAGQGDETEAQSAPSLAATSTPLLETETPERSEPLEEEIVILYSRAGQVWALDIQQGTERQLTEFAADSVIREMIPSPDGRYLAMVLNGSLLHILDLESTLLIESIDATPDLLGSLIWSPGSTAVYYKQVVIDPDTSAPIGTELWRVTGEPAAGAVRLFGLEEANGRDLTPLLALPAGHLVVSASSNDEVPTYFLLAEGELSPLGFGPFQGGTIFDFLPDTYRLLVADPGHSAIYAVTLVLFEGLSNPVLLTPDEDAIYLSARFGEDLTRVLVRRSRGSAGVEVCVVPADGSTDLRVLPVEPGYTALAAEWLDSRRVVIQM